MAWDENWEKVFSSRPWGKYPGEELIRFIARNFYKVEDRSKVKILEVGSGTGANLWYMAREGFQIFGVEGSRSGVAFSLQRLDAEVPGWSGEVRQGDIIKLPYGDGLFDCVIDMEALCCNDWESTRSIVKEMWRVLKPGGKFFSRTFSTGTWWAEEMGKQVGRDAWQICDGPVEGCTFLRLLRKEDIDELYSPFHVQAKELLIVTEDNGGKEIREWLISGVKM